MQRDKTTLKTTGVLKNTVSGFWCYRPALTITGESYRCIFSYHLPSSGYEWHSLTFHVADIYKMQKINILGGKIFLNVHKMHDVKAKQPLIFHLVFPHIILNQWEIVWFQWENITLWVCVFRSEVSLYVCTMQIS